MKALLAVICAFTAHFTITHTIFIVEKELPFFLFLFAQSGHFLKHHLYFKMDKSGAKISILWLSEQAK